MSTIHDVVWSKYFNTIQCNRYSYDAFQFNERIREKANTTGVTIDVNNGGPDIISEQIEGKNRGRVPLYIMFEVGFEDCDYISLESDWSVWSRIALAAPLELHVPCRDPLDHLMSQCNHRRIDFDCETTNLRHQVQKCFVKPTRFHANLTLEHEMSLRCFNPTPIEPYLEYMDQFLERKRIETSYYHRDSNTPRKKDKECIWQHPEIKERVLEILYESDYYRWCNNCIGSENELVLQHQR